MSSVSTYMEESLRVHALRAAGESTPFFRQHVFGLDVMNERFCRMFGEFLVEFTGIGPYP